MNDLMKQFFDKGQYLQQCVSICGMFAYPVRHTRKEIDLQVCLMPL